jgi:hypothetical protein
MWLELHDALIDHVKIKRLSRAVTRPTVTVRGHLVTLWLNVLRHAPDGNLVDWTTDDIADYAEWDGDAATFVQALVDCRLLDKADDGHLEAHDWREYAGQLKVAERKRKERETKKVRPVTVTDESRDVTRQSRDTSGHGRDATVNVALTGQDRTRPDQTGPDQSVDQTRRVAQSAKRLVDALNAACLFAEISPVDRKRWWNLGEASPITDEEIAHAIGIAQAKRPEFPGPFVCSVIERQRKDVKNLPPAPVRQSSEPTPPPANSIAARHREWSAIGKPHGVYGLCAPDIKEIQALGSTPEAIDAACRAADKASPDIGATWADVIAILRSPEAVAC